jgi:hypothetical protein
MKEKKVSKAISLCGVDVMIYLKPITTSKTRQIK